MQARIRFRRARIKLGDIGSLFLSCVIIQAEILVERNTESRMEIILAHRQLDFDALASMVAAQKLYPHSVIVMEGKPSQYVQDFLALTKDQIPFKPGADIPLEDVTRVILVDTHDLKRVGSVGEKAAGLDIPVVVYDHHPYAGPLQPGMQIEAVGACTTLLVEKIASLSLQLSPFEATLLALGIYDDTGSLLFESTTVRDVRAVAFLLEQGAQLGVVAENLSRPLSDDQKALLQKVLDNGHTESFKAISVYLSFAECEDYIGGLALIAHRVGELEGPETWFLVVKMENRVYFVGRSRTRGLPVHQIAAAFGGSGHEKAAAATIKGMNIEAVLVKLRQEIAKHVEEPFLVSDIMSHPVKTVPPETKLGDVEQLLLRYGHTGVPVVDGARLVGIISRRDVEKALKHGLGHAPVKGFMATQVVTVDANAPWDVAQRLMVQHDIGRLPVVENGCIVGIVSRSDVLRRIHGSAVPIEPVLARERSRAVREDILGLLGRLPEGVRQLLEAARETAGEQGVLVYAVGGFVRDLLLLSATQDLDFVVEGNGPQFAEALVQRLGEGELTVHPQFGTASILFEDGTHLDVATTRWEYYDYPGALPQVEVSSLQDDLFRRDFTINAMAICLVPGDYGELVDYYGGVRDLQQGEIRLLHQLSFVEDPTRILRAVRFAERYHFHLAKETLEALATALENKVFEKLSRERFTEELLLIYGEERYLAMLAMLEKTEVLEAWFGTRYPWNLAVDGKRTLQGRSERWVCSLRQFDFQAAVEVLAQLRLPRGLREDTFLYFRLRQELAGRSDSIVELDQKLAKVARWLIECLSTEPSLAEPLLAYLQALAQMDMAVDGKVLQRVGVKEGVLIGRILSRIRQGWLTGEVQNRGEEERLMAYLIQREQGKG